MVSESAQQPKLKPIAISDLQLDPENPRLIVDGEATQIALLTQLYEEEGLDELVHSFLENGYFAEEPLVVVPEGDGYTVVEGNRRLATLKLLLDGKLRRRVGVSGWPSPSSAQSKRLQVVPCVVYERRADVLPYLGYRHITGAKKWAPFQRARFVSQMITSGRSLADIEESLGDNSATIKKLYQDYLVYDQLVEEFGYSASRIRSRFSLLEVALGQRAIKKFIGLPHRLPTGLTSSLVPEGRGRELLELATWIFGDDSAQPIIDDSRDISKKLAKVIEDHDALSELRASGDIDEALDRLGGEEKYLLRRLAVAQRALRDVLAVFPSYASSESIVSSVRRITALLSTLEHQLSAGTQPDNQ